jgi:hypothetical protein
MDKYVPAWEPLIWHKKDDKASTAYIPFLAKRTQTLIRVCVLVSFGLRWHYRFGKGAPFNPSAIGGAGLIMMAMLATCFLWPGYINCWRILY